MPLYAYECTKCSQVIEHISSFKDKPAEVTHFCDEGGAGHPALPIIGQIAHTRISIEGGGRKGYVTNLGNGRKTVKSATRIAYEHNMGNMSAKEFKESGRQASKSVYTKEYQRHCKDKGIKERKG